MEGCSTAPWCGRSLSRDAHVLAAVPSFRPAPAWEPTPRHCRSTRTSSAVLSYPWQGLSRGQRVSHGLSLWSEVRMQVATSHEPYSSSHEPYSSGQATGCRIHDIMRVILSRSRVHSVESTRELSGHVSSPSFVTLPKNTLKCILIKCLARKTTNTVFSRFQTKVPWY